MCFFEVSSAWEAAEKTRPSLIRHAQTYMYQVLSRRILSQTNMGICMASVTMRTSTYSSSRSTMEGHKTGEFKSAIGGDEVVQPERAEECHSDKYMYLVAL